MFFSPSPRPPSLSCLVHRSPLGNLNGFLSAWNESENKYCSSYLCSLLLLLFIGVRFNTNMGSGSPFKSPERKWKRIGETNKNKINVVNLLYRRTPNAYCKKKQNEEEKKTLNANGVKNKETSNNNETMCDQKKKKEKKKTVEFCYGWAWRCVVRTKLVKMKH